VAIGYNVSVVNERGENTTDRDRLILKYLPQVRLIARQYKERLPGSVGLDDLVSAGVAGLVAAVEIFDPAKTSDLETYAVSRIKRAMLDLLRSLDWASRSRRIGDAISSFEQRNLRAPSEADIAAELGISVDEYRSWMLDPGGPEDLIDRCLDERDELLARKYSVGLEPEDDRRLAEIDRLLVKEEIRKADLIAAQGDERLARIDAGLDRIESAIRDLQALSLR